MASVGNLKVRLALDAKKFQKGIKSVQRRLGRIQTMMASAFAGSGASWLIRTAQDAATAADKINKLSDALGESVDFIQFLGFAAERSGSDLTAMSTAIQRLSRRASNFAKTGGGEVASVIDELSDEFRELVLSGASVEEMLPVLADDIESLSTSGDKLRVAMKLVDSEGARPLIAMLKGGRKSVTDLQSDFEEFGGSLSKGTLDDFSSFLDALTNFGLLATNTLSPILRILAGQFIKWTEEVRKNAKEIKLWLQVAALVAEYGGFNQIKRAGRVAGLKRPKPEPMFSEPIGPPTAEEFEREQLEKKFRSIIPPAEKPFAWLHSEDEQDQALPWKDLDLYRVQASFADIKDIVGVSLDDMRDLFDHWFFDIEERFGEMSEVIFENFYALLDGFSTGIGIAVADALVYGTNLADGLKSLFQSLTHFIISQLIKIAVQRVLLAALSVVTGKATDKALISSHAGVAYTASYAWWAGVNPLIAGVMAALHATEALTGGMAFLAEGGLVTRPTLAMIGEGSGPELVLPLSKAEKFFNSGNMTVVVELDGETMSQIVTEYQPGVLRMQGVGV